MDMASLFIEAMVSRLCMLNCDFTTKTFTLYVERLSSGNRSEMRSGGIKSVLLTLSKNIDDFKNQACRGFSNHQHSGLGTT